MNRPQLSLLYLVGSFILLFIGMAYGASQVIAYFNTGADQQGILMLGSKSVNDYYQPKIIWRPLENQGRPMEEATLNKLSKDYLASYFHQQHAMRTGETAGLHDYYTEKAREHLITLVSSHQETNQFSRGTTISHDARLDFYSEDGTIATLTDRVIRYSKLQIGEDQYSVYDTSEYQVMLLLEDNYWRVRHVVRGDYYDHPPLKSKARLNPDSLFMSDGLSFKIKGLNYYPKDHPWQEMWTNFDSIDFKKDFKFISDNGFNTLRIFVPYQAFGGSNVQSKQQEKLVRFLDLAQEAELKIIVTLFDFFLGYPIEEWTLSDRHAESIVNTVKDHPALLAWDVKNEPDLDFEHIGKEEVLEWLNFMIKRIRTYDPATPVTIGWSQPEAMTYLEDQVDFLSFHYYRDPEELASILNKMDSTKPLFLGETGTHSFDTWWYPFKHSEAYQLEYYENIGSTIRDFDLHYAFWTLYDFHKIPSNVAGKWPWQKGPQKSYGLLRQDESPKSSFQWIKTFNQR